MSAWFVGKTRAAWLLGVGLVLAGFVPVVLFVAAALLPPSQGSNALSIFPALPPEAMARADTFLKKRRIAWRPSPHHAALPFAALGLLVMVAGAALVRRQSRVLDAMKSRRQDAQRRAAYYRASERAEPTFAGEAGYATRRNETRDSPPATSAMRAAAAQR